MCLIMYNLIAPLRESRKKRRERERERDEGRVIKVAYRSLIIIGSRTRRKST